MAEKTFTLYDPSGEKYEAATKREATRLKAYGYTETAPKAASKSSDKS